MSGSAGYPTLEIHILSINVLGLISSFFKLSSKWDQQLERIWNLSVSRSDESTVDDIDWLKKTLSWIVAGRHIIDRVLLLAYLVNISTLLIRKWQNLLIFWMVLSFIKDIVFEIVVIISTVLLWHQDNVPTSRLIKFIAEKTIWFAFSIEFCEFCEFCEKNINLVLDGRIYKWYMTLKWYMQLRRAAKFRKFTIIAHQSIANTIRAPGRVNYSLEDLYLDASIARRSIHFDLRISKSLTTLTISNDSRDTTDTNDNDFIPNELNVAEKSMKMLNITAEDVMDARARIQERSYWDEQDAKISEAIEEQVAEYSLEKDNTETNASMLKESIATDYVKDIMDHTLRKEDFLRFPLIAKELKKYDNKTFLNARKKEMLIKKQKEEITLMKKIMLDEEGSCSGTQSAFDSHPMTKIKEKESTKFAKIVECCSSKDAKDIKTKPCDSLVKLKTRLEEEHYLTTEKERDQVDQKRHQGETKLISADSSKNNKEWFKNPDTPCHHEKSVQSLNNEITDIDKRGFPSSVPDNASNIDAQKDNFHQYSFTFKYFKYHLMKPIERFEASSRRSEELLTTWGSMSLAQTARPSGYEKKTIDKSLVCQKYVQTETFNDSYDSLTQMRRKLRHLIRTQDGRSSNLHSVCNMMSFTTNNYAKHQETMEILKTFNDRSLLENEKKPTGCKRRNFPQNHISIEDRKATELRALKAYNKLTLLKYKRELEMRKKCESSSLINEQSMKKVECNRKEIKTIKKHNFLLHRKRSSSEEASALRTHNELTLSENWREQKMERRHDLSKHEMPAQYEENIKVPTSASEHVSETNHEETTISSTTETGQITNHGNFDTSDARRPPNLREITRNIEWTLHPTFRGIILTNKNLHSQFLENGRFRESQQRDIVDDNTASTLHAAFFYKPEITRIFRAVQMRISESSFPNLSTFGQEDLNAEFVCRLHNDMIMRYQDSLVDLERLIASRRNGSTSLCDNARNDQNISSRENNNRDMCMIFLDREQVGNESDTAIAEDSTTDTWEDAHSSVDDVHTTNATNDNLPLQLIVDVLRNFGVEVPESSVHVSSSIEQLEEHGNISNRILNKDCETNGHVIDNIHINEDNDNEHEVLLNQTVNIDNTFDDSNERALNMNCSDGEVVSSVNFTDISHKAQDEKYLNAIDVDFERTIYENDVSLENISNNANLQTSDNDNNNYLEFSTLNNTTEKIDSCFLQNSSQSCSSGPSLFELANYHASKSNDEELETLTQFSNETALDNQGKSKYDVYEMATGFITDQFSKMNSNVKLQQADSFDSTYERNNDNSESPVSLEEGSLMEEFSNDSMSLRTASNASILL